MQCRPVVMPRPSAYAATAPDVPCSTSHLPSTGMLPPISRHKYTGNCTHTLIMPCEYCACVPVCTQGTHGARMTCASYRPPTGPLLAMRASVINRQLHLPVAPCSPPQHPDSHTPAHPHAHSGGAPTPWEAGLQQSNTQHNGAPARR